MRSQEDDSSPLFLPTWESSAAPKDSSGNLDHIDALRFRSQTEKHKLSHLYEAEIKTWATPAV